jgi:hypothetical protein
MRDCVVAVIAGHGQECGLEAPRLSGRAVRPSVRTYGAELNGQPVGPVPSFLSQYVARHWLLASGFQMFLGFHASSRTSTAFPPAHVMFLFNR